VHVTGSVTQRGLAAGKTSARQVLAQGCGVRRRAAAVLEHLAGQAAASAHTRCCSLHQGSFNASARLVCEDHRGRQTVSVGAHGIASISKDTAVAANPSSCATVHAADDLLVQRQVSNSAKRSSSPQRRRGRSRGAAASPRRLGWWRCLPGGRRRPAPPAAAGAATRRTAPGIACGLGVMQVCNAFEAVARVRPGNCHHG